MFKQKHTQWPGPGRTNRNVVGERFFPRYAAKQGAFFLIVFGGDRADGRAVPDQPGLAVRPVQGGGGLRGEPAGLVRAVPRRLDPVVPGLGDPFRSVRLHPPAACSGRRWCCPGILTMLPMAYPFIEARLQQGQRPSTTCCSGRGTCLPAPRSAPWRSPSTLVLTVSGANDVVADKFDISLNAMTWAGRIGLILLPPVAYASPTGSAWACSSTTGRCSRTASRPASSGACRTAGSSRFTSRSADEHGRAAGVHRLPRCPKKMNRFGALAPAIRGFFVPLEEPAAPPSVKPAVSAEQRPAELPKGEQ